MKYLLTVAVVGALLGRGTQPAKASLNDLAWMTGSWSGSSQGIEMEEHWTAPRGNSMIGIHRDVGKGRTVVIRVSADRSPERSDRVSVDAGKAGSEEWRWSPGALK